MDSGEPTRLGDAQLLADEVTVDLLKLRLVGYIAHVSFAVAVDEKMRKRRAVDAESHGVVWKARSKLHAICIDGEKPLALCDIKDIAHAAIQFGRIRGLVGAYGACSWTI